ncbi:MAG: acyltransferase [Caulobacterales bacterium 32-69-10]|nr:MAG: acyltransferase [Caulobacterales bacterium 32-69-10]
MTWLGVSTHAVTPPIQRGGWLDALRFVVAFLIIIYHYQWAAPIPLDQLSPVLHRGYLLTNFFIIDSGYVLARIYGERMRSGRHAYGAFVAKRLSRIVPAHLMVLCALVLIVLGATAAGFAPSHGTWFDWSQLPAQLFLVQAYGVPGGIGWNAPTWSISALLGCYLAFPALLRCLAKLGPWAVLSAVLGVYCGANIVSWQAFGLGVYELPLRHGFIRALPLFFVGMALARVSEQVFLPRRIASGLGILAFSGLVATLAFGASDLLALALIGGVIVAAGALPPVHPSRFVERAAVISFSMFITNEVVRVAWFGAADLAAARLALSTLAQWGLWAGGVCAAIFCAVAFHIFLDTPTQAWLKSRLLWSRPLKAAPAIQM